MLAKLLLKLKHKNSNSPRGGAADHHGRHYDTASVTSSTRTSKLVTRAEDLINRDGDDDVTDMSVIDSVTQDDGEADVCCLLNLFLFFYFLN